MKVLYVDVNAVHLNPTATHLPILFGQNFDDVSYFGPGFISDIELSNGILKYIEKTGPYDVLVIGANTPILIENKKSGIPATADYLCKYTYQKSRKQILISFFNDIHQSVPDIDIQIKIISTLNFDYYSATAKQVEMLLNNNLIVLGPNEQFILPVDALPDFAKNEPHYLRKLDRVSDVWREYIKENPSKIITALHFIADEELGFSPISGRSDKVSVPGVAYFLRKEAKKILRQSNIKCDSNWLLNIYKGANKIGFPVYSDFYLQKLYNLAFRHKLMTRKYVYTARGVFGIPIRKFFEIPAAGATLICSPCNGFSDLGFKKDVHYIHSEPEELPSVISQINDDTNKAQEIASKGRDLILNHHTIYKRGGQIKMCLDAIMNNSYQGSYWENGGFFLKKTI